MKTPYSDAFRYARAVLGRYIGARWVTFREPANGSMPPFPCCYAIYGASGSLLYIGQTIDLRNRIGEHLSGGRFGQAITVKARFGEKFGDWLMREARLIARLRPPMNRRLS